MSGINDRIAKAKGWRWDEHHSYMCGTGTYATWINPEGYGVDHPNYISTLEGVAGLMRELGPDWAWHHHFDSWTCFELSLRPTALRFRSPDDRPGDCVGEAYVSVFGKEADDD